LIHKPNLFAFTGGPGAGKTTLLRRLQALGETCVQESARAVIQAEAKAGRERPTGLAFCELMLARDLAAFRGAGAQRTFLDRSLVDAWGTARVMGIAEWAQGEAAVRAHRLNRRVFVFPPWKAIYATDTERIQTWTEAVQSFERCCEAYADAGYELTQMPLSDVDERVAFVLEASSAG
jgi:predicted ATPase